MNVIALDNKISN